MKDKDSRLIYEAWQDRAHAAGEEFGRSGKKAFLTPDEQAAEDENTGDLRGVWADTQTIEQVLKVHGWDIERQDDGKWWRFDAPGGARPVTGDEHWDIMAIEDPEKYAEYKAKIAHIQNSRYAGD